jgi:RNA polymerase sigma-70 factor, ECF subfamily
MKRRKSVFAPATELSLDQLMPVRTNTDGRVAIEIADWSALPDDLLLQAELRDTLAAAIGELPETYRSVILLRDLEELSTQETAQILDVTEDVVKTRLHRARLAVRQKLDQQLRSARSAPAELSKQGG